MITQDIAKQLHAKTFMHSLYVEARLPAKTPRHFSELFETCTFSKSAYEQKIISVKWKRSMEGRTLPRRSFVESLPEDFNKSKTLYFSPIWLALKPTMPSSKKLIDFFKSLPFGIKRVLGSDLPEHASDLNSILLAPAKVMKIYRSLDVGALACLIMLMRLEQQNEVNRRLGEYPLRSMYRFCESLAYIIVTQLVSKEPFQEYAYDIFQCITENVVSSENNELCTKRLWQQRAKQFEVQRFILSECAQLAKMNGIVRCKQHQADFLFYLMHCSQSYVLWQLKNRLENRQVEDPFEEQGIDWIIHKMNQHNPSVSSTELH